MQVSGVSPNISSLVGGVSGVTGGKGPGRFSQLAAEQFSAIDTNGDGSVSQDEFAAALQQLSSASGTSAPTSGTSTAAGNGSNLFRKLDTNGDGQISASEWSAFQQKIGAMGHHHHHRAAGGDDNQSNSASTPSSGNQSDSVNSILQNLVTNLYKSADANSDGQLSQQELTSYLQKTLGSASVNFLS